MRPPDEIIGHQRAPHMRRWYLFRGKRLQVCLHHWLSDDERLLHDHAWWNATIVLKGFAVEYTPDEAVGLRPGSIRFRRATDRHRIELQSASMWTLFITGPVTREWGYWRRDRFTPWRQHVTRVKLGEARLGVEGQGEERRGVAWKG